MINESFGEWKNKQFDTWQHKIFVVIPELVKLTSHGIVGDAVCVRMSTLVVSHTTGVKTYIFPV